MFRKMALILIFLFLLTPFCIIGANEPLSFEEWKAEKEKRTADNQQLEVKENQESILYRNDEYKFRINFPAGWEMKDGDGEHVVKKAVKDGATVMVLVNADFINSGLTKEEQLSEEDIESAELNDFSDEEANTFLETIISAQLESFPGSTILEKGIRYVDNRKAVYFKMNQVYRVQDIKTEGISMNYFTVHKGKLYQIGGMYPTVPVSEKEKESIINASLATFVFEDWGDQVQAVNTVDDPKNPANPIKEAFGYSYGENLNNSGLFLVVILSIFFTWGLGLLVPILLRFFILKRPISKWVSLIVVFSVLFIQILISQAINSENRTHSALILVAFVSYWIMRKENKVKELTKYCRECGNKISTKATICNKCNKVLIDKK